MASRGLLPSLRSAASAKSIIMMAFFFTMPISRMMPIMAMMLRSVWVSMQRQQRAHTGRRQRGENRDGMNVAFVQDSEHDVDRGQRRGDQQGLAAERILIGLRGAGEAGLDGGRKADLRRAASSIASTASPSATPGSRLNEMVTDGNSPWWLTASGADGGTVVGEGAQRNLLAAGRAHVNLAQGFGILPELRRRFHHHVILIERRVHGGHLALAEGVVERVVDQLRRDAEARGGVAVVLITRLQAVDSAGRC